MNLKLRGKRTQFALLYLFGTLTLMLLGNMILLTIVLMLKDGNARSVESLNTNWITFDRLNKYNLEHLYSLM